MTGFRGSHAPAIRASFPAGRRGTAIPRPLHRSDWQSARPLGGEFRSTGFSGAPDARLHRRWRRPFSPRVRPDNTRLPVRPRGTPHRRGGRPRSAAAVVRAALQRMFRGHPIRIQATWFTGRSEVPPRSRSPGGPNGHRGTKTQWQKTQWQRTQGQKTLGAAKTMGSTTHWGPPIFVTRRGGRLASVYRLLMRFTGPGATSPGSESSRNCIT